MCQSLFPALGDSIFGSLLPSLGALVQIGVSVLGAGKSERQGRHLKGKEWHKNCQQQETVLKFFFVSFVQLLNWKWLQSPQNKDNC